MPALPSLSSPLSPAELSYLHTSLSSIPPIRSDGRAATQFRSLTAETDILPSTNGSAHLSFSDGSEAIVGVKVDVERTTYSEAAQTSQEDVEMGLGEGDREGREEKVIGRGEWVELSVDTTGLRDDDPLLVFLSEMLREGLLSGSGLADRLVINRRWHYKLHVDILLLSPLTNTLSLPLPLLSLTTHLALLSTRLPALKSTGEEDPLFDDDWDAAIPLYSRSTSTRPPITLLAIFVESNTIHDPSREELAVADAVFAISVSISSSLALGDGRSNVRIHSLRTLNTASRDTFAGVPASALSTTKTGANVEEASVWKPRVGGFKRERLKELMRDLEGVAREIVEGLEGFVLRET